MCRAYVQPQWVFDCVNRRKVLPTGLYAPGAPLPPHLSPFVEESEEDYVPPERMDQLAEDNQEEMEFNLDGVFVYTVLHVLCPLCTYVCTLLCVLNQIHHSTYVRIQNCTCAASVSYVLITERFSEVN